MKDTLSHPWLKIDPRERGWLDAVSKEAVFVWFCLQMYQSNTGGTEFVHRSKVEVAVARRMKGPALANAIAELIGEGQLVEHPDGWELAVWEQPPVEIWQDDTLRWRWQRNNRLKRMSELREFVKTRDRSLCRYCGNRVNWADKKGRAGATYDHVDPDGDNLRDNLVVACRRCNGIKKDRTPEQAGMPLYRPGTTAQQIAARAAPMLAASATSAPIPDPRARPKPPPRSRSDPDPIQIRSGSGPRFPRARPRDRPDPDPIQIASHHRPPVGVSLPGDGSVPALLQTGGAIRLRVDDPAHPDHYLRESDHVPSS